MEFAFDICRIADLQQFHEIFGDYQFDLPVGRGVEGKIRAVLTYVNSTNILS